MVIAEPLGVTEEESGLVHADESASLSEVANEPQQSTTVDTIQEVVDRYNAYNIEEPLTLEGVAAALQYTMPPDRIHAVQEQPPIEPAGNGPLLDAQFVTPHTYQWYYAPGATTVNYTYVTTATATLGAGQTWSPNFTITLGSNTNMGTWGYFGGDTDNRRQTERPRPTPAQQQRRNEERRRNETQARYATWRERSGRQGINWAERTEFSWRERAMIRGRGYLTVRSPNHAGRKYRIPAVAYDQIEMREGQTPVERLCLQPTIYGMNAADWVYMMKVMLLADEERFLASANHFPIAADRAYHDGDNNPADARYSGEYDVDDDITDAAMYAAFLNAETADEFERVS